MGIFGKKSDHPLADLKTARQLLEAIPASDVLLALHELTSWVEMLVEIADEFRVDHEFEVLRMFDEAAQPHLRKLFHDYFTTQAQTKFQESRLWTALNQYFTYSEQAYHHVLTRVRDGAPGQSSLRPEWPLLGVRAIAALSGRLKLCAARYAMVDPVLWRHLADFYSHAEGEGYLGDALRIYPGAAESTSVEQECAGLLMWYGLKSGTLSPLQEHIAERLLAHVSAGLAMDREFAGEGIFAFDLNQPTPPMRVSGDVTIHPGLRYVGTGTAAGRLHELEKVLDKGIVPDNLYLYGATCAPELLDDSVRRLVHALTQPAQTRRNPRRKISVNLQVANGFFRMMEQADANASLFAGVTETWDVEDISATGFRSVLPLARADGIQIGALIGSRPENVAHWGAGIVRRLSRDDQNNMHIGVEMLSTHILGVSLAGSEGNAGAEAQMALYLYRPADTSGEAWLLMKPASFSMSRSLSMQMESRKYLLFPQAMVENGLDYDLARYRCMLQENDAE